MSPILGRMVDVETIGHAPQPWQLVRCCETGFVFLLDPPSYDAVADEFVWEKTFAEERAARRKQEPIMSRISAAIKNLRAVFFSNRDKLFSLAMRNFPASRKVNSADQVAVLDVGSGCGNSAVSFCRNLKSRNVDAVPSGIEISMELARASGSAFASYGGHVVQDSAFEGLTKFDASSFDFVIMSCYLEHECQPLEVLRRTAQILKNDGMILVKVPNYDSWNRLARGRRWCGFRFPDHVNYFTPTTLRLLADQAGYEVLPQRLSDCLPTSDNFYAVLKKRQGDPVLSDAA